MSPNMNVKAGVVDSGVIEEDGTVDGVGIFAVDFVVDSGVPVVVARR